MEHHLGLVRLEEPFDFSGVADIAHDRHQTGPLGEAVAQFELQLKEPALVLIQSDQRLGPKFQDLTAQLAPN